MPSARTNPEATLAGALPGTAASQAMQGVTLDGAWRRREPARQRFAGINRWVGAAVALMLAGAGLWGVAQHRASQAAGHQAQDQQRVTAAAATVESQLKQALATAETVDMLLRSTGSTAGFDRMAAEIMARSPLVASLALAPSGVVSQVYPRDRADADIGWRLLADPAVRVEAEEATRQRTMVAGVPRPLPGGGVGVAALLPVVAVEGDRLAPAGFWGFVVIVVRVPPMATLLAEAGLRVGQGDFSLAHFHAESSARQVFHPVPAPALKAPVSAPIRLPQRSWTLSVSSAEPVPMGWHEPAVAAAALLCGWAVSRVVGLRRRARVRRSYFHHSSALSQWASELDTAQRQLDRLRHRTGWAVILAVRLPALSTPSRRRVDRGEAASAWHVGLRTLLRQQDLAVPMRAHEYLLVAHGIRSRADAAQVSKRLQRQLQALARHETRNPQAATVVTAQLAELGRHDLGTIFAELLLQLHAVDEDARAVPPSGPLPWQSSTRGEWRDAPPTEPMRPAFAP